MEAKQIDPKINSAYSYNLYKWLQRHQSTKQFEIYESSLGGELYHNLFIGTYNICGCCSDVFTGYKIKNILIGDKGINSYPSLSLKHRPDIEEAYLKIGRCAFDIDHKIIFADNDRYKLNEFKNIRTCNWCGHKQEKHTYIEVIENKRTEWIECRQEILPFGEIK